MQRQSRPLTLNWSFTQIGGGHGTKDGEWLPASQLPTSVHLELLKHKKIPDPFIAANEWDVQWIGEAQWAFRTIFEVTENEMIFKHLDIVFEGMDTFAEVELNGRGILETSSQFLTYRVSVKDYLTVGPNELRLIFSSTFLKGRELEILHGKLIAWNGDPSRLYVRKAQYNYGWDWGPVLLTVGPWKPISFQIYDIRIIDVDIRTRFYPNHVLLRVGCTFSSKFRGMASVRIYNPGGNELFLAGSVEIVDDEEICFEFFLMPNAVKRWYPIGHGAQPLYRAEFTISDSKKNVLDSKIQKFAFRKVRVIQEELVGSEGLSFVFEVNNIRIFCGGSNWIPADSFVTRVTPEQYRAWLQLVVDGNQNMLRVWGGGIYEADVFYDICDELGVLVWQDFMFACGQYPAHDSFLELVKKEAEQVVKRLRHHPSVVIFVGNNEDYQLAEAGKLDLDYADEDSDYRLTNFPARHIYERLLPPIVRRLSSVHYHRGSPYSGQGQPTSNPDFGDLHQWNVWHGSQEHWQQWDRLSGRFVSEFGMQGFPNIRTVDYWLGGDKSERHPQSRVNGCHNKASGYERRLELYLVENFRHEFDMESYVYYTQLMQAEAISTAFRLWKRNWKGKGREYTAGALVWQLNDCWPCTSWSVADYFRRPKPAYFAMARELREVTVGVKRWDRKTFADDRTAAFYTLETVLEIWAVNMTEQEREFTLHVDFFDLHETGGGEEKQRGWTKKVKLGKNTCSELFEGSIEEGERRTSESQVPRTVIVSTRLVDDSGLVVARCCNWPEPYKLIRFPTHEEMGLEVRVASDGETVHLSSKRPIKGLVFDVEDDGGEAEDVKWSDQALDVFPSDPQTVRAVGLKGRRVKVRHLS